MEGVAQVMVAAAKLRRRLLTIRQLVMTVAFYLPHTTIATTAVGIDQGLDYDGGCY